MKKTFSLVHPKIKAERLVESFKSEVKKYIRRERKKKLPEGFSAWNFDCKFGSDADSAKRVQESDVTRLIGEVLNKDQESFYLELIAVPGQKPDKPVKEAPAEKEDSDED